MIWVRYHRIRSSHHHVVVAVFDHMSTLPKDVFDDSSINYLRILWLQRNVTVAVFDHRRVLPQDSLMTGVCYQRILTSHKSLIKWVRYHSILWSYEYVTTAFCGHRSTLPQLFLITRVRDHSIIRLQEYVTTAKKVSRLLLLHLSGKYLVIIKQIIILRSKLHPIFSAYYTDT